MKVLKLTQGTPEWHTHRANSRNASDAPAMMGESPYKTRAQLIRERATGVTPDIDAATQRRFDDGHRYEALARPLAEEIIGEELYPCIGASDCGGYSASFDGLTLLYDVAFEHKSLNDALRATMIDGGAADDLPLYYHIQLEQQAMVSGANRILFMATKWDANDHLVEKRYAWYTPNMELRARIIAGWKLLDADVEAYVPEAAPAPVPAGDAPDKLPVLHVHVTGAVTASNADAFRDHAMAVIGAINRDLVTDEDFADAKATVKWCGEVEAKLDQARDAVLAQTADIAGVLAMLDEVRETARRTRLDLNKLVVTREQEVRAEIAHAAIEQVREHLASINKTLPPAFHLDLPADLRGALAEAQKGRRTLATITDAVSAAAADAKITLTQHGERVSANAAIITGVPRHLVPDAADLVHGHTPAALAEIIDARKLRAEAEASRIASEAAAAAEARVRAQAQAKDDAARAAVKKNEAESAAHAKAETKTAAAPPHNAEYTLGQFNALIAPFRVTTGGLAELGIEPERRGASAIYTGDDIRRALAAMTTIAERVMHQRAATEECAA